MKLSRRVLRQAGGQYVSSVSSLSFNFAGLLAGFILASSIEAVAAVPWGLFLFPSIISVRGAIGGLFSGRISTALHIGTIRPSLRGNNGHLRLLYDATTVLTLAMGIVLWLFAYGFGYVLFDLSLSDALSMLLVIMVTLGLSTLVVSPATAIVSIASVRRGFDPDVVTYPIISTVADIMVTSIYVVVIMGTEQPWSSIVYAAIALVFVVVSSSLFWVDRHEPDMMETLRETMIVLPTIALFVNISGSALDRISQFIANDPVIYMIYPALIDTVGDVGSIVGSTATTRLNLGTASLSRRIFRDQFPNIAGAWGASITLFILYALLSMVAFGRHVLAQGWTTLGRVLLTNVMAVSLCVLISLTLAVGTFRRGWDPDNFVIPIESTLADALTSMSLFVAVMVMR
ncbi:MAG: magnesium transporter [Candidatus Thorarchaeota archaeon]